MQPNLDLTGGPGLSWANVRVQGQSSRVRMVDVVNPQATVVIIHGFASSPALGDREAVAKLATHQELSALRARVIAPVLPGFSGTPALQRGDFTLDDYADWVIECLLKLRVQGPVILFGESMGGAIASLVAAKRVLDLRGIVLFNSIGGETTHASPNEWVASALAMTTPRSDKKAQWREAALDYALAFGRLSATRRTIAQLMSVDLRPALRRIRSARIPTVAVFSRGDPLILAASGKTFADELDIDPLYIAGDHRSFIDGHPAASLLVNRFVEAVVSGERIDRNLADLIAIDRLREHDISIVLGDVRSEAVTPQRSRLFRRRRTSTSV